MEAALERVALDIRDGEEVAMPSVRSHTDKRVIKTRRAIKQALLMLLEDHDLADITPADVAEAALISKKTFLVHYSSVSEVVEELENESVEDLSLILGEGDLLSDRIRLAQALSRARDTFSDTTSQLGRLFRSRARNDLLDKMRGLVEEKLRSGIQEGEVRLSYATEFVAGGMVSVCKRWFSSDDEATPEEVADIVSSIAAGGIGSTKTDV
jgi:AcrR family transcriptional regulator